MSLKTRLSRLQTQAGTTATTTVESPAASSLRNRLAQLRPERVQAPTTTGTGAMPVTELAGHLDGELIAEGVIRISKRLSLTGKGRVAILRPGAAPTGLQNPPAGAPASARLHSNPSRPGGRSYRVENLQALRTPPRLPGEPVNADRRCVYIDTETTGLSGGSGTLAFLIGMAVVEVDAIVLTQFLMTRFAAEADMLATFADTLSAGDQLVSYNGKSYDLPLLITRFRMQALTHPFDGLAHLDLLYPVRRLFSKCWNDCRLLTLEQNLLGFTRIDDLPGAEAPEAWFSYIRGGRGKRLIKVIEHNQQDIVSLAVAHSALTQAIELPRSFDVDFYGLARWLSEHNTEAARELLRANTVHLCDDGKRLLGDLSRRAGDWQQALLIWEELATRGCTESLERLAKYHEHISKDLAAAQRCCTLLPGGPPYEQRRRRINAKLGRLQ